ncbi:MAG: transposase [Gloeotrichia echinulata DEX184]|jgi:putative transposase
MLNRTGHFWEKRYWCEGFPPSDTARALNTLRYIHANPKAATMKQGFFYDFSNYGSYDKLTDDGLTQWHPAFLTLGKTLDECAKKYRGFCQRYKPKAKKARTCHWGSKLLAGKQISRPARRKMSPGQLDIWLQCQISETDDVARVADQFVRANRAPYQAHDGR